MSECHLFFNCQLSVSSVKRLFHWNNSSNFFPSPEYCSVRFYQQTVIIVKKNFLFIFRCLLGRDFALTIECGSNCTSLARNLENKERLHNEVIMCISIGECLALDFPSKCVLVRLV